MTDNFRQMVREFNITKPVMLHHDDLQQLVLNDDHVLIVTPQDTENFELVQLLIRAKLAEQDPLLAVFFFQERYDPLKAERFSDLCSPLQHAWIYRYLRQHHRAIYDAQIEDVKAMLEILLSSPEAPDLYSVHGQVTLNLFGIMLSDPASEINITHPAEWLKYFEVLKSYAPCEPDPCLYCALADTMGMHMHVYDGTLIEHAIM